MLCHFPFLRPAWLVVFHLCVMYSFTMPGRTPRRSTAIMRVVSERPCAAASSDVYLRKHAFLKNENIIDSFQWYGLEASDDEGRGPSSLHAAGFCYLCQRCGCDVR